MNPAFLQPQLQLPYRLETWRALLPRLFPGVELFNQPVDFPLTAVSQREIASHRRQFGRATLADGKALAFFEIHLTERPDLVRNRVGLRRLIADCLADGQADAVLGFFPQAGKTAYRLTYASRETRIDAETFDLVSRETAARRFTYVLGTPDPHRTPASRLAGLANQAERRDAVTLAHVTEAFSVERLNREFFDTYRAHYRKFCDYLLAGDTPARVFGLALDGLADKALDLARKPVRDFVKKLLGRLVFLHFLQKKGWLGCAALPPAQAALLQADMPWDDGRPDFLRELFLTCADPARFHGTTLVPLFFDTLNAPARPGCLFAVTGTRVPYLNGGLFERDFPRVSELDFPARFWSADTEDGLLDFLSQYHFTIDENDPEESEIGIDPEMLGHIFENLLEDNKDKGAYYTPKAVVQYMAQQSLIHALAGRFPGDAEARAGIETLIRAKEPIDARANTWLARHAARLAGYLDDLKICDPAIGSGAFPIGVLQEIYWTKLAINSGLDRAEAKRRIIQRSIHGVDLDAGAVEIARLRFWLALVVDEKKPSPLPNLDYQIMQGNSLLESFEGERLDGLTEPVRYGVRQRLGSEDAELDLGAASFPGEMTLTVHTPAQHDLAELQRRYFACHEPEAKARLRAEIDAAVLRAIDARLALRRSELEASLRARSAFVGRANERGAEKTRAAMQAELDGLTGKSERLHALLADPRKERPFFLWHLWFREVFEKGGFDIVIANPPYIPMERMPENERRLFQASYPELTRKFDSAAVFILHGLQLLKPGGCLTFISSITWQTGENYADLRKTMFRRAGLRKVINLPFDIFAEAYVDTCIYVITPEIAPSYRISILPKRAKILDLATVPFVEIDSELVCEPNFKLVLSPNATALFRKIATTPGVLTLGAISQSTQGLAGNRFRRVTDALGALHKPFAERLSISRFGLNIQERSFVEMSEHQSLAKYYAAGPKFLIRRIISRQDRLVVVRCDEEIVFKKDVSPFLLTETSIKPDYLLALLNSRLLSWLYVNTSSIATKDDFRQTTLTELRALPIAPGSIHDQTILSELVVSILTAKRTGDETTVRDLEAQIDAHVYRLYGLTAEEISIVENAATPQ